ncbi:hypothetical protein PUN28_007984 [Cardiocondyla obscurior]|uniref:Uncharacterized protein n=1 Tax=Cardiocondyla obscurior TaxID=286306 RepID=A0AAW2FXQ3_9HYME
MRLGKHNGEKLPEFPRDQFNKLNKKSLIKTLTQSSNKDTLETKPKRDIVTENITKQGKKLHVDPIKRIPATNNFVYQFNSFAKQSRLSTLQTHLSRANNSEQILPHSTTDLAKQKPSIVLPKLNSGVNFVTSPNLNKTSSSSTKNTCLLILGKKDQTRTLIKQADKKCEQHDTEHEVKNVKSAWQILCEKKDWTKSRDYIDERDADVKKLQEMLEKMTCKIDKIQKNYMDAKASRYLQRSVTSVFGTGKSNLKEETGLVRGTIFPDGKAKIKSTLRRLTNVDNETIDKDMTRIQSDEDQDNVLTNKQSQKNLLSSKYTAKKRSIHTEAHKQNIANTARSVHTIAPNISKERDTVVTNIIKPKHTNKTGAKTKCSFKEYLQRYSVDIHKSLGIEDRERTRHVEPSSINIADILAKHNIEPHMYKYFQKRGCDSGDCASESDESYSYSDIATNIMQVTSADN